MSIADLPRQVTPGLITPTGVLVYDGPPVTDEWFTARRRGITATDIAQILDMSEHGNARSVWLDKQGMKPDDQSGEAALWGNLLEDPVAQEWARRNSAQVAPVGILARAGESWKLASLDRIVLDCPDGDGRCGLEVKTRSAFVAGKWRDDIPDDVLAQVMWGIHVSGFDHMHVAALIGGQRMESYRVDRDDTVISYIEGAAARVWGDVQAGTMPECAPTPALGRLLDSLYPQGDGDTVVAPETAAVLAAEYTDACTEFKAAEARKDAAKVAVQDVLGAGERIVVEDADGPRVVFAYPQRSKTTVTASVAKNNPDLWAGLVEVGAVKVSTYRQITFKGDQS